MQLFVGKNAVIATKKYGEKKETNPELAKLLKRLSTIGNHEITKQEQVAILNWLKSIVKDPEMKPILAGLSRFFERVDNLEAKEIKAKAQAPKSTAQKPSAKPATKPSSKEDMELHRINANAQNS